MKMTAQLEKHLPNIVDKNVNMKETIVGKVTEYDMETGLATFEIDDDLCTNIEWNPFAGHDIGISSRIKSVE